MKLFFVWNHKFYYKMSNIHFFVPDFFSIPDYTYQRSKYALQIFFISSQTIFAAPPLTPTGIIKFP